MKNLKHTALFVALLLCFGTYGQNNLLDTSTWTVGTGSVSGFNRTGSNAENVREEGGDPFGETSIIWRATPDANNNNDGGWNTPYLNIDHTKTYRLTVWVKKTNSNGGNTRFGFNSRDASNAQTNLRTNGTSLNNPYFFNGDLPTLDQWYLLVGFVHGSAYSGNEILSGVYDPITGIKILNAATDFKFAPTALTLRHRAFLSNTTNTADYQYMFGPTLYEVDGQEPSIASLLPAAPSGDSPWVTNGQDISYSTGNVAIGTANVPTGYALAVDGNIIGEEVRVELSASWPDYVFEKGYNLPSLSQVRKFIGAKGHLPNVPSARTVEQQGVKLGEMNRLLLEKIEEQMLYILQLEDRIKKLENKRKN